MFLLPLGVFAGRFCWFDLTDPIYHGWMWLHERLGLVLIVLAVVTITAALFRFAAIQKSLSALIALGRTPPPRVRQAFAEQNGSTPRIVYVPANQAFCFTIFDGPTVVMSSAFEQQVDDQELALVAEHESLHVRRRDPWRALAWHLSFAALILPGFEGVEQALHVARERTVDRQIEGRVPSDRYRDLLLRLSRRKDRATTLCSNAITRSRGPALGDEPSNLWIARALPAALSLALLTLVVLSHAVFMENLPYLQMHHC